MPYTVQDTKMISSSEIFTAHTHYVLTSSLPIAKDGVEGVCVRVCICKGWVGMGWGSVDHHVTCVTHRLPLSPMPSNVYIASVILVYTIHKVCGKTHCVHQISIHSTLVSLLFSLRPLGLPHHVIPPVNARWWD